MAIKKTIILSSGLVANDAYIRVVRVNVTWKNSGNVEMSYHVSADQPPFQTRQFSFQYDLQGDNPWRQAYQYIKTLPEFEGAEDC